METVKTVDESLEALSMELTLHLLLHSYDLEIILSRNLQLLQIPLQGLHHIHYYHISDNEVPSGNLHRIQLTDYKRLDHRPDIRFPLHP